MSNSRDFRKTALRFVLLIGIVSFFADFTYEGSRSVTGPFLLSLGASGAVVASVAGLGELLGYGLRFFSGKASERTQRFWPIAFVGYIVQMASVPLLALAGNWQVAAVLILLERTGKAIRNPPRDVMLSHAAEKIGYGWGFGVHEALDQFGAVFGPLLVALILAHHGQYRTAFGTLLIPAIVVLIMLSIARALYPRPEDLAVQQTSIHTSGLPHVFWIYLCAAALVAAGFADFQLIAFHFQRTASVRSIWIPVFYAIAMAISGAGSLFFGKIFDRFGIKVLIPLTILSAISAPLVFWGGFWIALVGIGLWGLGMGVSESIIPAAVATMVPANRRPSAYGLFTGAYGVSWFAGSVVIGVLYDRTLLGAVLFSMVIQLAAIPVLVFVNRQMPA